MDHIICISTFLLNILALNELIIVVSPILSNETALLHLLVPLYKWPTCCYHSAVLLAFARPSTQTMHADYKTIFSHCGLVVTYGVSDYVQHWLRNGLMPDGTKPLPESMLNCHQRGQVTIIWGQFHKRYPNHKSSKWAWILICNIVFKFVREMPERPLTHMYYLNFHLLRAQ